MNTKLKKNRIRERHLDEASQMLTQRDEINAGSTVFVIGLDYDVKDAIHWTEAVTGILGKTHVPFKVHPTKRVRCCIECSTSRLPSCRIHRLPRPQPQATLHVALNPRPGPRKNRHDQHHHQLPEAPQRHRSESEHQHL